MHHSMRYKLARTAAVGGIMVLGLGSAQVAMARPAQGPNVPCSTSDLDTALATASSGEVLVLAPGCTYWLDSALPAINTDLTIIGDGATLRRVHDAPGFTILSVTSAVNVTISTLSFENGDGDQGGAIYSDDGADITINGGVFEDNFAFFAGGAIYNGDGTLSVSAATFLDNTSAVGGAIYNDDIASVTRGTFIGNRAIFTTDNDAIGGAIYNDWHLQVSHSTFSGNSSEDVGGVLFNDSDGTASLLNDAQFTNSAGFAGGAIFNFEGTVNVTNGSITGNQAGNTGGGIFSEGGAVNLSGAFIHRNRPNNCTPDFDGCFN